MMIPLPGSSNIIIYVIRVTTSNSRHLHPSIRVSGDTDTVVTFIIILLEGVLKPGICCLFFKG